MSKLMDKLKAFMATHGRLMEIVRFGLTGGICFLVEFGVLTALVELAHMDPVPWATAIAFLVSVLVNYLMCVWWVFRGAKDGKASVRTAFLLTSVMGFGLNELFMWLLVSVLSVHYMIAKVISTLLVMVWNYLTKRRVLVGKV